MNEFLIVYKDFLETFLNEIGTDLEKISNLTISLSLTILPFDLLLTLCREIENIFKDELCLISLMSPCYIVGDLHGHLLDLIRIIRNYGYPINYRLLFMGDLVDRGEFSLEVVIIVYILKILWPKNVFIIRGNHEFSFLCNRCGFSSQIASTYNDSQIFDAFIKSFSWMPLSALVDRKILCIHGGLGPKCYSIQQLLEIKRPIFEFGQDLIDSLLWSDPSNLIDYFQISNRGMGYLFGKIAIEQFLETNSIDLLIRAHECVMNGCEYSLNNKVLTVFSASNYCGLVGNESGLIYINLTSNLEIKRFKPLEYLKRIDITFKNKNILKNNKSIKKLINSESSIILHRIKVVEPKSPHLNKVNQRFQQLECIKKNNSILNSDNNNKKKRNATFG